MGHIANFFNHKKRDFRLENKIRTIAFSTLIIIGRLDKKIKWAAMLKYVGRIHSPIRFF